MKPAPYHGVNLGVGVGTVMAAGRGGKIVCVKALYFRVVLVPAAFNSDRMLQSAELYSVRLQHPAGSEYVLKKHHITLYLQVYSFVWYKRAVRGSESGLWTQNNMHDIL